jgi:hypothetical protein
LSIFRDLGAAVSNIVRPDGGPIINIPNTVSVIAGSARQITNAINSVGATLNPSAPSSVNSDPTKTSVVYTSTVQRPLGGPPYQNVLEQFASYTPVWTLCCLDPNQFNNPTSYRSNPNSLKNIILSSAGRFDEKRANTTNGAPEYFVDNFNMKMEIAPKKSTGNTNVTLFTFDVYEPYSMGLFLQSMKTAAIEAGYPSYLADTPYLLKLEFMGFDDQGNIFKSSDKLTKYFTIKINQIEFKVNEGGSQYQVTAMPYHHLGYSDLSNRLANEVLITGENVKEMLVSGERSLCSVLNGIQLELTNKGQQGMPDIYEIVFPIDWNDDIGLDTGSSVEVLKATADPKKQVKQPITGRVGQNSTNFGSGEIGTSSMGFSAASGGNYLFKLEGDVIDPNTGRIQRDKMSIDPAQRSFTFPQGDRITEVISKVILASKYAQDALKPENLVDGMVKWFRIDVQMQMMDYDIKRNVKAKKYIYRVVPFKVHGSIFKNPTSAPAGLDKLDKIIAKRYDYLYTGQNNDILKFDISLNGLWYTGQMPRPPAQHTQVTNKDINSSSDETNQQAVVQTGPAVSGVASQSGAGVVKPDPSIQTSSASGNKTVEEIVADAFNNAFLNGTKDLANVTIDILGDPYFIADSGINSNYLAEYGPNNMITSDGTMNYEGNEIFVYLSWRNPIEPNLGTTGQGGLYTFPKGETVSPFSGIYKLTYVTNKFTGGTFQQTLEMLRVQGQPNDFIGQESIVKQNQLLYDTSKPEPPKTKPIDDTEYSEFDL